VNLFRLGVFEHDDVQSDEAAGEEERQGDDANEGEYCVSAESLTGMRGVMCVGEGRTRRVTETNDAAADDGRSRVYQSSERTAKQALHHGG
jgi:hypothetical protein